MVNDEIFLLSFLTISIFSILLILLLYLTIRKAFDIRRRKEIEGYKEKYNMLIFTMLAEGTHTRILNPENQLQLQAIEELLSRYSKVIEGIEEKKHLQELAERYLTNYYQRKLKSRRWSIRMNSLYHIEDFNMEMLKNDVFLLIEKKRITHQELVHALRILSLSNDSRIFKLLTEKVNQLSVYDYRNILVRIGQKYFDQFILHFHKSPLPLQESIIDVISLKKEVSYLPFVENIFSTYRGEVRLKALKALAHIGYVDDVGPYLSLLYSEKWEERMVAAKLVGSLREESAIPRLVELLHDPSWWVRSQAGKAIVQYPKGKEILRTVLTDSKDPFAKDMAWEWLYKGV